MMKWLNVIYIFIFLLGCSPGDDPKNRQQVSGEIDEIPRAIIVIDGEEHVLNHGQYFLEKSGYVEQTDAASPIQIAETFEPFQLAENPQIEISISGNPTISVDEWDSTGQTTKVPLENNMFNVQETSGEVIYEVISQWKNAEASYTFVVQINL